MDYATPNVPLPAREMTLEEAATAVAEAAQIVARAGPAFLAARDEWQKAGAQLDQVMAGYVKARERHGL